MSSFGVMQSTVPWLLAAPNSGLADSLAEGADQNCYYLA